MSSDFINQLNKAQNGDVESFAEIFEEFRSTVFAIAYRLVGANDAEDIVMETYIKAWKGIPNYNRRSSLTTWLYRITHNTAMDFLRKQKRDQNRVSCEYDLENPPLEIYSGNDQILPSTRLEKSEVAELVNEAMAKLDSEHRATLWLRFADGLSYKEIASATGTHIGTVMSRIYNGKKKLKKILLALEIQKTKS